MKKLLFFLLIAFIGTGIFKATNLSIFAPKISYNRNTELGDFVVISFSLPISEQAAKRSFNIWPPIEGELEWLSSDKELYFIPLNGFQPNIPYTVTIRVQNWFMAQLTGKQKKHSFQPEGLPTKFNARIPGEETIYYITESGLKRPRTLEVFLSYPGNKIEDIRLIDKSTLELYPDNLLIHLENDPHGRVYKIENGKKHHIENPIVFNSLGLDWKAIAPLNQFEFDFYPEGAQITLPTFEKRPEQKDVQGKLVEFNLKKMEVVLWENGIIKEKMPIAATGNPRLTPTRKGLFSALAKYEKRFSRLSKVWMPWSIQYSGNYFIHGWPYWPSGKPLASKYSAGCIRLKTEDAKKVYDFTEIGTPILVH